MDIETLYPSDISSDELILDLITTAEENLSKDITIYEKIRSSENPRSLGENDSFILGLYEDHQINLSVHKYDIEHKFEDKSLFFHIVSSKIPEFNLWVILYPNISFSYTNKDIQLEKDLENDQEIIGGSIAHPIPKSRMLKLAIINRDIFCNILNSCLMVILLCNRESDFFYKIYAQHESIVFKTGIHDESSNDWIGGRLKIRYDGTEQDILVEKTTYDSTGVTIIDKKVIVVRSELFRELYLYQNLVYSNYDSLTDKEKFAVNTIKNMLRFLGLNTKL